MIDMTPEAIHFLVRGVLVSAPHGRCNLTHDQTIAVCNEVERLAARVAELEAENAELRDVARAAVVKLDAVFDAVNSGPMMLAHVHGMPYTGPIVEPEFGALKALLNATARQLEQ